MTNTRKNELLEFLDHVQNDQLVGVYYLDKTLNIAHYSIYEYTELNVLRDKLKKFDSELEDPIIKILSWRANSSKDYLIGVYEGIALGSENDLVNEK